MRLTKRALASKLNTSERSLTSWQRQGMPVLEHGRRGRENAYDLGAVLNWIMATRDPAKIHVNIAALQLELGTRSPAIDARVIARAIGQAVVVFFEELQVCPEDFDAPPAELAEAIGSFNFMLCNQLARAGIAGVGEAMDAVASDDAWPAALEDIIARARAEVPPAP